MARGHGHVMKVRDVKFDEAVRFPDFRSAAGLLGVHDSHGALNGVPQRDVPRRRMSCAPPHSPQHPQWT